MINRLIAFALLITSASLSSAEPARVWALEAQGATIFQFEIHHSASGWSATWVRPTDFDIIGQSFRKVLGPAIRRSAASVRVQGDDLILSFDDPRVGATPNVFRIHHIDADHATADYIGSRKEPFPLIRKALSVKLRGWDPDRIYTVDMKRSMNLEMTAIFDADQRARQSPTIDWTIVSPQDDNRRERTQILLEDGALSSGDDFFHAAFIFQHGNSAADFLKAHLLATVAVARGSEGATSIAAAALDRYLQAIGKDQILGTQFRTGPDGRTTQDPYNRSFASNQLRVALGVPTLAEQEEQRKSYEKQATPPVTLASKPPLQDLPPAPPAKVFSAKRRSIECDAIPDANKVLARPGVRWVIVGEIHGTKEIPKAFADLVCLASATGPVTVAVEEVTSEQTAIDEFIGSDGSPAAKAQFLSSKIWTESMKDGRSSTAYFELFNRLRELREAGRITSVVAFQPLYNPGPAGFSMSDYENALASSLIARVRQGSHALVLTGDLHAARTSPVWATPPYVPMAGYLPAETSINLATSSNGGHAWACTTEESCGPQPAPPSATTATRGITLGHGGETYDGVLNLGIQVTASPPQPQPAQKLQSK